MGEFPLQPSAGCRLPHGLLIIIVDAGLYVTPHALLQNQISGKDGLQNICAAVSASEGISGAGIQVKIADQAVLYAESMDQFDLMSFLLLLLQFLTLLLGRAVQQKSLVDQFPVLPDQLDISHDIENVSRGVLDAVRHIDTVPLFFQSFETLLQPRPVLLQNGGSHHVKARRHKFLLGLVTQNPQRRSVNAGDPGSVQTVAHNAAVHRSEDGFQSLGSLQQFLRIFLLLGHINGHPYRTHDAAVQVIERGFVCGKQP